MSHPDPTLTYDDPTIGKKEFGYLQDKNLYGLGKLLAKVSGTINYRDGYSTVTRFEDKKIVFQWQARTLSTNEVDKAMQCILMLPFQPGPKLDSKWVDANKGMPSGCPSADLYQALKPEAI